MTESTLDAERSGAVAAASQPAGESRGGESRGGESRGGELDVIGALYQVAEDVGALDDLMVRAGLMWRCTRPERKWTCGHMNRADEHTCGGCGGKRAPAEERDLPTAA